jgi:hypothetical protein
LKNSFTITAKYIKPIAYCKGIYEISSRNLPLIPSPLKAEIGKIAKKIPPGFFGGEDKIQT